MFWKGFLGILFIMEISPDLSLGVHGGCPWHADHLVHNPFYKLKGIILVSSWKQDQSSINQSMWDGVKILVP